MGAGASQTAAAAIQNSSTDGLSRSVQLLSEPCRQKLCALLDDQDRLCVRVTTLAGHSCELSVTGDTSVRSLAARAADALKLDVGRIVLAHGADVLRNAGLTVEDAGLKHGAELTALLEHRSSQFVKRLWAEGGSACLKLLNLADSSEKNIAHFTDGSGYRCAVAESLPSSGIHTVCFDFIKYCAIGSYHAAYGLNANPDRINSGPLGDFGWIAETPGGICVSDGSGAIRHAGKTVCRFPAFTMGKLCTGSTAAVSVDHDKQTLQWVLFLGPDGKTREQCDMALPLDLVGQELFPTFSSTSSGGISVRVRADSPWAPTCQSCEVDVLALEAANEP